MVLIGFATCVHFLMFFNSVKDNQELLSPSPADKCGMKQPGQIYSQQNVIMIVITHRFI